MRLSWDPPPEERRNGNITSYKAILTPMDSDAQRMEKTVCFLSPLKWLRLKRSLLVKTARRLFWSSSFVVSLLNNVINRERFGYLEARVKYCVKNMAPLGYLHYSPMAHFIIFLDFGFVSPVIPEVHVLRLTPGWEGGVTREFEKLRATKRIQEYIEWANRRRNEFRVK